MFWMNLFVDYTVGFFWWGGGKQRFFMGEEMKAIHCTLQRSPVVAVVLWRLASCTAHSL